MSSAHRQSVVHAHGFTLLEAVIALALMSMILIASLELRVQAMRTGASIGDACRDARPMNDLYTMLINRALPEPVRDEQTQQPVWSGDYLGKPYRITRVRETVENPVASTVQHEPGQQTTVRVWRYTMRYDNQEMAFIWRR